MKPAEPPFHDDEKTQERARCGANGYAPLHSKTELIQILRSRSPRQLVKVYKVHGADVYIHRALTPFPRWLLALDL